MMNPKKFLDRIKEEVMYYAFKHGRFDLKEMTLINKSYKQTWHTITINLIVWTAILSINMMSLIYIRSFLNVSWTQCFIAGLIASYVMKKGFDKFITFSKSINKTVATEK